MSEADWICDIENCLRCELMKPIVMGEEDGVFGRVMMVNGIRKIVDIVPEDDIAENGYSYIVVMGRTLKFKS